MVAQALSPRGTGTTRTARRPRGLGHGHHRTGRNGLGGLRPGRPPFCYWRAAWPVARGPEAEGIGWRCCGGAPARARDPRRLLSATTSTEH
jgi:hypothetical protein